MNRSKYFNYIEEKLSFLAFRIKERGRFNLLDLNIYAETFYKDFLNLLLGYKCTNKNIISQNSAAIDLVDENSKVIIQVSSTCSKQKIESTLKKKALIDYSNYNFKFIAITGDASRLRKEEFKNPHEIAFIPNQDILDNNSICNIILHMKIDKQKKIFNFIRNELGNGLDIVRFDTNLAIILDILSKESLETVIEAKEINAFEIDKKIVFNELELVADVIDDYKIYYAKLNEKYQEFDKQGLNKSLSILRHIKSEYVKLLSSNLSSEVVFYKIIENVSALIMNSKNYIELPYEELDMYTTILVVDAFVRCKIFKNPAGYNYVITR